MKSIKKIEIIALILSVICFSIIAWFGIEIFIDFFIDKNTNINFESIKLVIKNHLWKILFSTLGLLFILFISIIAYLQFFDKRKKGPKILLNQQCF